MKIRKNPKVNLEHKRKIFLEIGFIVALLFVLLAFEYRTYEKKTIDLPDKELFVIEEEAIPITKDKQETPKPPPPIYREIKVTDQVADIGEDDFPEIDFGEDVYEDWTPSEQPEEVIPDDIPVRFTSDPAEFPGGLNEMYKFLASRIVYPAAARETGVQGTVYIDFVIEKDGTVSNIMVMRGIGFGCDEEAVRVIQLMPKWKPAKQNLHQVRMAMTIPVKFTLH